MPSEILEEIEKIAELANYSQTSWRSAIKLLLLAIQDFFFAQPISSIIF